MQCFYHTEDGRRESVRAGALIVGFNLPFDIARIAANWTVAHNGGFSFVLSQLSETHVDNIHRPRIRIAPLNGVAEKIELTAVRSKNEQDRWRRGRFLDLHALAFALTDNSYSLADAIKAFGSKPEKMEHEPTGLVSEKEITYARQDVRVTLGLLNALKQEYSLHPIALPPDKAYSPASIGKSYLRAMGIIEPMQKFKQIPAKIHGIAMAAYYGGRAECRIRRWPVPVVPVDLTSEYPSVDALLHIWDALTAKRLSIKDVTNEVRSLLASLTLEQLFQPDTWKRLNFYAQVVTDNDVLPVRSVYDSKSGTCNIGLNSLRWKQPMWVAGPDLVTSVLLSGHIPDVRKAIRVVPHGKQRGLRSIKLRSTITVDPKTEDFFTRVIEYRKQNKNDDRLQYFLKILANSTSYGTYLELNPVRIDPKQRPRITVHSGEHVFDQIAPDTIEQPGRFYFPLLGALITAGGRLLLGMIERCVRDAGGTYMCCDTDALIIVANKFGGTVRMPDGSTSVKALSWPQVQQIADRFDSLSPYNRKIVPHLLRLTDENFDKKGNQRQLFGLSIAAKRYACRWSASLDSSARDDENGNFNTPLHYMDQMKGKASSFGFVLHPRTRDRLKLTLLTPLSKSREGWAKSRCVNTHDGKVYRLDEFPDADVISLGDILCGYVNHPEIKSLGPDGAKCQAHTRGLLRRMAIKGGLQHCIGKEVSRFEEGKNDFIESVDDMCIHYDGGRVAANESLIAEISRRGLRRTTKRTRLDRKTIRAVLNGQKVKISTLAKLVMGLREEQERSA